MNLTIAEKFLLLSLKPQKTGYCIDDARLNSGLIGSILLDLSFDDKINIQGKILHTNDSRTKLSKVHQQMLQTMADAAKPRKIRRWISKFKPKGRSIRHSILQDMQDKQLLRLENKRFLIFPYKTVKLLETRTRSKLITILRDSILKARDIDTQTASLMALIQACRMHKVISSNKQDMKQIRAKLKNILVDQPIAQGVEQVIRETQAAVSAAIVVTATS